MRRVRSATRGHSLLIGGEATIKSQASDPTNGHLSYSRASITAVSTHRTHATRIIGTSTAKSTRKLSLPRRDVYRPWIRTRFELELCILVDLLRTSVVAVAVAVATSMKPDPQDLRIYRAEICTRISVIHELEGAVHSALRGRVFSK